MVADECERYDTNSFEDTIVDDEGASQLASGFGGDAEGLGNNSNDDDDHADKGETAGLGKLLKVS